MLKHLSLSLDGQHHCGLDDCRNITKIVVALAQRGHVYQNTGKGNYSPNGIKLPLRQPEK